MLGLMTLTTLGSVIAIAAHQVRTVRKQQKP